MDKWLFFFVGILVSYLIWLYVGWAMRVRDKRRYYEGQEERVLTLLLQNGARTKQGLLDVGHLWLDAARLETTLWSLEDRGEVVVQDIGTFHKPMPVYTITAEGKYRVLAHHMAIAGWHTPMRVEARNDNVPDQHTYH
jgi:hypothetical protein